MPQGRFAAQVSAWVAETKERQLFVFRESAQRVVALAQTPVAKGGNMPVDTGFLRASGVAFLGSSLPGARDKPAGDKKFNYDAAAVELVIKGAQITDTITFAYTANYAVYAEYGSHGRAGRRFVGLAAQQWAAIVEQVCREAQSRAGG